MFLFVFFFQIFRFPRTRSVRFFEILGVVLGAEGAKEREVSRFGGKIWAPKALRDAKRPVLGEI